jgi:hypothetical protein
MSQWLIRSHNRDSNSHAHKAQASEIENVFTA